ncbi:MAG: glutamate--tRNA ligase [Dehalococcoidia bacterium]|jgi:glutamyl-tRNA synthetase|nr:glutamate--tRNA ligase [Dehalococcoidia bacterium]
MVTSDVRVRYAPSPTGTPHVGNIRTALFNWLFARHHAGKFIVRIEDTDQERRVEGAEEAILDSLRWLGLDWDEGPDTADGPFAPYVQSQRRQLYQDAAERLIESDDAYRCYCSSARLDALRERQTKRKAPTGYDRKCRNLSQEERAEVEASGAAPVVRFKTPLTGKTTFEDAIRGLVTWENRLIDDFVLLKSDGFPTYHLANIVDDHEMRISHVFRADEWLASTPRHVLLYAAFGWDPPIFAHMPLILGADRSKLSKRHGAVALLDYSEQGFLPDAMLNFLALLGWSLDDKTTVMSREDLVNGFTLDRVVASPAIFDVEKLSWINGVYIRELPTDQFAEAALPFLTSGLPGDVPRPLDWSYTREVCELVQDRARTLHEITELADFFYTGGVEFPLALVWVGMGDKQLKRRVDEGADLSDEPVPEDAPVVTGWLEAAERRLIELDREWTAERVEEALRSLVPEIDSSTRKLFGALRVALTGRTAAPPLFETMEVLDRAICLERIGRALDRLREGHQRQRIDSAKATPTSD